MFAEEGGKDGDGGGGGGGDGVAGGGSGSGGGAVVGMVNVTVTTPKGADLVRLLSFQVMRGQRLLVMGPSGCGKTSMLRVLTGLWKPGKKLILG